MNEKIPQNNIELFNEKELESFIKDLDQYDKDHGHGAWMGRALAGMLMNEFESTNEDGEVVKGDQKGLENLKKKIDANLKIDEVISKHKKTLEKMGLDLESPNKQGDIDEQETYAVGEIEIDLIDNTKYISFLKSIKDQPTEAQTRILETIGKKLAHQFKTKYDLGEPDDKLLELLSGLRQIISEYNRIGIDAGMKDLQEFLDHASSGYLREYVFAKNHRVFEPIGEGFNLSTYQRDASYDIYVRNWDWNLFHTLDEVKKNPNAKQLFDQIVDYAKNCLDFASKDPKMDEYNQTHPEYVSNIKRAIKDTRDKLDSYLK